MNYKIFLANIALVINFSCRAQTVIKVNDPHIRYSGRIAFTDSTAILSWSGSSIKINFIGSGISFKMHEEGDDYYTVIINGKIMGVIHPNKNQDEEISVGGQTVGTQCLELFKRTEWAMGKTLFYGFKLGKGGRVLPVVPIPKHKIEFYGNSITCGMADEDTTGRDRGASEFENGYASYAAITARHFDAEFYNISKSGIGVTVSWFPLIMPEMYDLMDPSDANNKWDFTKYTPDVVVVNLFQNDSWIVKQPENGQFKARFGNTPPTAQFIINAYQSFIKNLRAKYPKASIVCILGSMDASVEGSPWPGYIEKAVTPLNDQKIYTHIIPYKKTPGHPSVKEQQAIADDLIGFMEKNVKW